MSSGLMTSFSLSCTCLRDSFFFLFFACVFSAQLFSDADRTSCHHRIGTEDVFQAIINGSQKYVDGDRMVDSISGMFSCHRGPIRWLLSPNRNPKR